MMLFKQNRFLSTTTIILVVLNVASLTMLLVGRPGPPKLGHEQIGVLLQKELGFDEAQITQYIRLRHTLQQKVDLSEMRIRSVKKEMFEQALQEKAPENISDSLLNIIQTEQAGVEMITYQHIRALKEICKPEQRNNLGHLLHTLIMKKPHGQRGPSSRFNPELPPPPPKD